MKVDARLTFDKIRHDQDTNAHLVVTLTAPPIEAQIKRPSLCIIPLIDVSPSMEGIKLAYAKRSIEKLIEHLGPNDYCGLVKFSGQAEVLQKPVKMTADTKALLKRQIADLHTDSSTNIADAMLVGLDIGNKMDLPGSVIVRVVLFTDGQANRGPATDAAGLVKILQSNIGSCTMSAFGYGSDADQNLLAELAKVGNGNYAFVQNPDDALTAFGKELGGLLSCYGTNLLLNVSACGEHEITDVVSDVDSEEEKVGQGVRIKIPDILAEEVRHIVLAVKVKAQKAVGPRAVNVFEVKTGWDILDVNSKKERKGCEAKAKAQFVKEGDQQIKPDAELDKIVSLAEVVQAQAEAEELAKKGNYSGAVQVMQNAAAAVGGRGHAQTRHLAAQVGARLGSHSLYASSGGYLRSVSGGVTRGVGTTSYEASAAADLNSLGVQMSNSTQSTTSNTFAGAGVVIPDAPPAVPWAQGGIDLSSPVWGQGAVPNGIMSGSLTVGSGSLAGSGLSVGGGVDFASLLQAAPPAPPPPAPAPSKPSKKGLSKKQKSTW